MAKVKQTCACVFLLVLMISCGIIFTEARSLKNKSRDCKNHGTVYAKDGDRDQIGIEGCNNIPNSRRYVIEYEAADSKPAAPEGYDTPTVVGNVVNKRDDFRPTAPGHSPGAGHSTGPSTIGPYV
ncbi:hypothetical protein FNV43_RR11870 [Rhamnella rubrinervis]|uniref:Uncharacterized protein n=1 Tax=Rhamnella rubrinervis TaxID=2594499 RepID=A0A8K0MIA6_9ROSA|nr:hypothetical protein FNV43_RR11870 [Rhamnella rubrinervis]